MKLFALVAFSMLAFAGNSVLNRIGVAELGMDPFTFALIRVAAGVAVLWALILTRKSAKLDWHKPKRYAGAASLALYMIGFSVAYLSLGAGLGALILFGLLQLLMFGWALVEGQKITVFRWAGAGVALAGLCVLLWPTGGAAVPFAGAVAMILATIGWAVYTLLGRGEADALGATGVNFALCLPLMLVAFLWADGGGLSVGGVIVAILSGAVTSGLGYALWYKVLPQLETVTAAIAQLSVPVIAVVAGVLLLDEALTVRLAIAGALVVGGIGLSLLKRS